MEPKTANTSVPIHELLAKRWSPRAFDPAKPVMREELQSLCEAARWAPSCFGDEPWRYVICDRTLDEEAWQRAFGCLVEKNQRWARNAPVLILSVASETFGRDDKPNRWGQHDTGAASLSLCLQATALGLIVHQMGGFDVARAREAFEIPDGFTPMAMMAVGHQAAPETLDEDFRESELGARERDPLERHFFRGTWGAGAQF